MTAMLTLANTPPPLRSRHSAQPWPPGPPSWSQDRRRSVGCTRTPLPGFSLGCPPLSRPGTRGVGRGRVPGQRRVHEERTGPEEVFSRGGDPFFEGEGERWDLKWCFLKDQET